MNTSIFKCPANTGKIKSLPFYPPDKPATSQGRKPTICAVMSNWEKEQKKKKKKKRIKDQFKVLSSNLLMNRWSREEHYSKNNWEILKVLLASKNRRLQQLSDRLTICVNRLTRLWSGWEVPVMELALKSSKNRKSAEFLTGSKWCIWKKREENCFLWILLLLNP